MRLCDKVAAPRKLCGKHAHRRVKAQFQLLIRTAGAVGSAIRIDAAAACACRTHLQAAAQQVQWCLVRLTIPNGDRPVFVLCMSAQPTEMQVVSVGNILAVWQMNTRDSRTTVQVRYLASTLRCCTLDQCYNDPILPATPTHDRILPATPPLHLHTTASSPSQRSAHPSPLLETPPALHWR